MEIQDGIPQNLPFYYWALPDPKVVRATKIAAMDLTDFRVTVVPVDQRIAPFVAPGLRIANLGMGSDAGYFVQYGPTEYSWWPTATFEEVFKPSKVVMDPNEGQPGAMIEKWGIDE